MISQCQPSCLDKNNITHIPMTASTANARATYIIHLGVLRANLIIQEFLSILQSFKISVPSVLSVREKSYLCTRSPPHALRLLHQPIEPFQRMRLLPLGSPLCRTGIEVEHRPDGAHMAMDVQLLLVCVRPFLLFWCCDGVDQHLPVRNQPQSLPRLHDIQFFQS